MIFHSLPKLMGGPANWEALGGTMCNLGITFAPIFWGFMASFAEGVGGLLILLGLLFRPAELIIIFTMIVASTLKFSTGEGWMGASDPIETGLALFHFLYTGPGKLSVNKK